MSARLWVFLKPILCLVTNKFTDNFSVKYLFFFSSIKLPEWNLQLLEINFVHFLLFCHRRHCADVFYGLPSHLSYDKYFMIMFVTLTDLWFSVAQCDERPTRGQKDKGLLLHLGKRFFCTCYIYKKLCFGTKKKVIRISYISLQHSNTVSLLDTRRDPTEYFFFNNQQQCSNCCAINRRMIKDLFN